MTVTPILPLDYTPVTTHGMLESDVLVGEAEDNWLYCIYWKQAKPLAQCTSSDLALVAMYVITFSVISTNVLIPPYFLVVAIFVCIL